METPEQSTKSAQKNNEYSLLTHCLFIVNFEQISHFAVSIADFERVNSNLKRVLQEKFHYSDFKKL